jgi:hypothetical protein
MLSGKSLSTLKSYGRHIAQIALHFNCLPSWTRSRSRIIST